MSIALDPVIVDDLPPYTTGQTIPVQTILQPDRISAARIFNNTPFDLKVINPPGLQQVWLPPYTEDIYGTNIDNPSSAFSSTSRGQLSITPVNIALRNNDTATTALGTYHPYEVLITVYELGDAVPSGLPIVHSQMVSVVGEALTPSTLVFNATFASGAAGSVTASISNVTAGNSIIQYATILGGFSIDLQSSGSQHNNSITVIGVAGAGTVTIDINVPATTPYSIFRNNLNWMSSGLGQASNQITVSFPAITGVAGSITAWAYAERVP
jgi:hypothetical protein